MIKYEVLDKLYNKDLKHKNAYKLLYTKKRRRKAKKARFIKLKIKIPEKSLMNVILKIVFLLPVPICLLIRILKKRLDEPIHDEIPIPLKSLIEMTAIKGAFIEVLTQDGIKIKVKTI